MVAIKQWVLAEIHWPQYKPIRHKQAVFAGSVLGQAREMEKIMWKKPLMFMIGLRHENIDYVLDEQREV